MRKFTRSLPTKTFIHALTAVFPKERLDMHIPATLAAAALLLSTGVQAKEYPIGEPQMCGGM